MKRFILWCATIIVAHASLGGAQSASRALDTLYVGHAPLGTVASSDSGEFDVLANDPASSNGERNVGHLSTRRRTIDDGGAVLFRVNHFSNSAASVTDSIRTRVSGLAPLSETSHQPTKLMHLRWAGRHVTGDVTPTGKPLEPVDQTMAVPPFNSSDQTLVLQALPLSLGYTALLATYEYEVGGLRIDTVSVVKREPLKIGRAARDTWVVRVSQNQGTAVFIWLDARTRDELQDEYRKADGSWSTRIVRR